MVHVTLPTGARDVPDNTVIAELCTEYDTDPQDPVVAAVVNNEVLDLSRRVRINAHIDPVHLSSDPGIRCYRQSLCFLLALAVKQTYPHRRLIIGHSLGDSYFHYFEDDEDLTDEVLERISRRMQELVETDMPIERRLISYADASEYFTTGGLSETASLLEHRNESRIAVHVCGDFMDISHGPLVPRTCSPALCCDSLHDGLPRLCAPTITASPSSPSTRSTRSGVGSSVSPLWDTSTGRPLTARSASSFT
jgi:uridine kinase